MNRRLLVLSIISSMVIAFGARSSTAQESDGAAEQKNIALQALVQEKARLEGQAVLLAAAERAMSQEVSELEQMRDRIREAVAYDSLHPSDSLRQAIAQAVQKYDARVDVLRQFYAKYRLLSDQYSRSCEAFVNRCKGMNVDPQVLPASVEAAPAAPPAPAPSGRTA